MAIVEIEIVTRSVSEVFRNQKINFVGRLGTLGIVSFNFYTKDKRKISFFP